MIAKINIYLGSHYTESKASIKDISKNVATTAH